MNYYNDNDPFICEWLENLISDGLIPQGEVDGRSILEVDPKELGGYQQHHFFAGVGGWSWALNLAGWGARKPVWTGSCPCQPLSCAGNGKGEKDERHLWPWFFRLIRECRPPTVFGEQVASTDGRDWLSAVRLDLETLGYAVGGSDLCAAGVGAPQVRQRLWWVAHLNGSGCIRPGSSQPERRQCGTISIRQSPEVSDFNQEGRQDTKGRGGSPKQNRREVNVPDDVGYRPHKWTPEPEMVRVVHGVSANPRAVGAYGNAIVPQVAAEFIRAFMDEMSNQPLDLTAKNRRKSA